jgi:hypothetical protein
MGYGPPEIDEPARDRRLEMVGEVHAPLGVQQDVNEAYLKINYAHDAARRRTGNVGVRVVDVQTTSERFHDEALMHLSAYCKDVPSWIGWTQEPQTFNRITYAVSLPVNGTGGSIYDAEFAFQTPFFWPALENCGV